MTVFASTVYNLLQPLTVFCACLMLHPRFLGSVSNMRKERNEESNTIIIIKRLRCLRNIL